MAVFPVIWNHNTTRLCESQRNTAKSWIYHCVLSSQFSSCRIYPAYNHNYRFRCIYTITSSIFDCITSPGSRVLSYLDGLSVKIDIFYSIETYKIWISMTVFAWLFFRFDLWIKFIKTLLNRKLLCKSTNVKLFIIFFLTYIRYRMTSTKRL